MLECEGNYQSSKAKVQKTCRLCNQAPETQEHILEQCKETLKERDNVIITKEKLFDNNIQELRKTAKRIIKIQEQLKTLEEKEQTTHNEKEKEQTPNT